MPAITTDLDGRRIVGAPVLYVPVTVTDRDGREIAIFRSPRKLGKALVSGELVVLNGDVFYVGKRAVIS